MFFSCQLASVHSPLVLSSMYSGIEPSALSGTGFLWSGCPSHHPAHSVRALKETSSTDPVITFCVSRRRRKMLASTSMYSLTFCVRRRRKMYCGNARRCVCVCLCVCVSVCLSVAVRPHYCMNPDVTRGRGTGCPLVVLY